MRGVLDPLLADVFPDIASVMERRLRRQGRDDLADSIKGLRIRSGVETVSHGAGYLTFEPIEPLERPPPGPEWLASDRSKWSVMYHPGRDRHWLGKVPRKRWTIIAEEIDGRIVELTL